LHSTGEVVGRNQRLVSWRSGLCAFLLAACGGGLVVLAVTLPHTLFPSLCSRCPSLHGGCSLAVSRFLGLCRLAWWAVGGSACRPSTWWRSEVAVPVVRQCLSRGYSVSLVVTPSCSFLTS
ncbi:hypothetical protein Taro_012365, partial [Colocasia esculenta]|nr:hypothetical protein [Colocasia esculenta]